MPGLDTYIGLGQLGALIVIAFRQGTIQSDIQNVKRRIAKLEGRYNQDH